MHWDGEKKEAPLSVRKALAGKHVMLIGVTGFIGKVWLANTLLDLPEIGKVYLLIRKQKSNPQSNDLKRSWRSRRSLIRYSIGTERDCRNFLAEKVEVVEGDVSQDGLGFSPEVSKRLSETLDVIINSSGLTDFNPDLRDALAINVDATAYLLEFIQKSDHCALLHLSTCYVAGARDGRVSGTIAPGLHAGGRRLILTPRKSGRSLHALVQETLARAEGPEVTEELTKQAIGKEHAAKNLQGAALENQIRKNRVRWLRTYLTDAGMKRAAELGWPNTYTLTKSMAESLIAKYGEWTCPLRWSVLRSWKLRWQSPSSGGTKASIHRRHCHICWEPTFRQLPSNERKRLDIIPVDSVCSRDDFDRGGFG